jgi:hypothetical protein
MGNSNERYWYEVRDEEDMVSCEVCMKEIPASEIRNSEAIDYVIHFCGLKCYEKWRKQTDVQDG